MTESDEAVEATLREALMNERLYSVVFVMDYVQFVFGDPILSAFTRPTIDVGGYALGWKDWGYRDALCEQITHAVVAASVRKGDALTLTFDTDAILRVSLKPTDLRPHAVEAVMFSVNRSTNPSMGRAEDKRWFVLRPNDD